jgi:hypothetical protein
MHPNHPPVKFPFPRDDIVMCYVESSRVKSMYTGAGASHHPAHVTERRYFPPCSFDITVGSTVIARLEVTLSSTVGAVPCSRKSPAEASIHASASLPAINTECLSPLA